MKKYFRVAVLLIVLLMLVCCSPKYKGDLRIRLKNDEMSSFGYAAAFYEERIYYVSNELGDMGVYSIKPDGSDVRVEVKNPSVTNIGLHNETLYFTGLNYIGKRQPTIQSGTINNHTLYTKAMGKDVKKAEYTKPGYNINGFFISPNGYTLVKDGAWMEQLKLYDPNYDESFSNIRHKVATIAFEYEDMEDEDEYQAQTAEEHDNIILKNIYKFGDVYMIAVYLDPHIDGSFQTHTEEPYVLDENTGELVLSYGYRQHKALKGLYMDGNNIYCAYKEMAVIIDREEYEVIKTIRPEGISHEYHIIYMGKHGDSIYMIADKWDDQERRILPLRGEKLYAMDADTFECKELLDLGEKQRVIGFYDSEVILLDDEAIYKVNPYDSGEGGGIKICDAPTSIHEVNHIIDYAGDWMFIYRSYPEHGPFTYGSGDIGQQLIMKVNLKGGEITQHNVELDFSLLDAYRE
ncbi:MAG: hypothetical protein ACOYJD_03505 [Christensenellales bacterium]|jgi:hypothetical protein